MESTSRAIFFTCLVVSTAAFSINPGSVRYKIRAVRPAVFASRPTSATTLGMSIESDFPSAMPAKPEQTMEEKLIDSATTYASWVEAKMGEGVPNPPELEALRAARDAGDPAKITSTMYELMIEVGMTYDENPDTGGLTPTEWNIEENLEMVEVKREFALLYDYGMKLIARGLVDVSTCKEIVKTRLIARTGKTPEEFDTWLGY